ncbi:MAG TPA: hypothetical protein VIE46_10945 [Gemmatimonadales bacterium]
MEIGRETPDSAVCARLLEEGWAVVMAALGRLGRAMSLRVSPTLRRPVRTCDD